MSASLGVERDWNFRIFDQRLVILKTKNQTIRKTAVLDILTNIMISMEVPESIEIDELVVGKEYLVHIQVYSLKYTGDVDKEFINFLETVDVNQNIEDFIKAYWVYPGKIRFRLESFEEP